MRRLAVPLALVLAAACAPAGPTPAAAPPMASAAPAETGIVGNYTVTVADADIPSSVTGDARTGITGAWAIAIHPGNHFVATYNGNQVAEGPYQVNGNQIVFPAGETGEYACTAPATYSWRVGNGQLTFTPVGDDPCGGRRIVLTAHPLALVP